jgi:hypothetical protein
MKAKVILLALVIALVVGLAVPAFVSQPANAWGRHTKDAAVVTPVQEPVPTTTPTTTTTLGPMMIGIMTSNNNFVGMALSIKLGGDGTLTLANLKGISLDGTFKLSLAYDPAPAPGGSGAVVSGTLTSSGKLPKGNTIAGGYFDLAAINVNLGGNYFLLLDTFGNSVEPDGWGAILMSNLPGLVTILPGALTAMGGPDISCLMPTIQGLVKMINPFMQNHPIILLMPMSSMIQLMPLMGM